MAIWRLDRRGRFAGSGYEVMLVCAPTAAEARAFAANGMYGDKGDGEVWLDPRETSCEEVPADGEPVFILGQYKKGRRR